MVAGVDFTVFVEFKRKVARLSGVGNGEGRIEERNYYLRNLEDVGVGRSLCYATIDTNGWTTSHILIGKCVNMVRGMWGDGNVGI